MTRGNTITDAQQAFHRSVWDAVNGLGASALATDALLGVLSRHRPEHLPDLPEKAKLFPGWTLVCVSCNTNYPCGTALEVAAPLGLCWEDPKP